MLRNLPRIIVLLSLLLGFALPAGAEAIAPETCLECHDDVVSAEDFGASVHGENSCTSCHSITDLDAHMEGEQIPEGVSCVNCHRDVTAQHNASVHLLNEITCTECHSEIHTQHSWDGNKQAVVDKCLECHEADGYAESVHGEAVAQGNADAPACNDCHGLHEVKPLDDKASLEYRNFHTSACLKCHADEEMMERNEVLAVAADTYLESYHGKSYRLGYPEIVAGCADCHSSHGVFGQDNPQATIHEDNLVATCGKCHENSTPLFTQFYPHGEHGDKENYPILYWTFMAMSGLLISTFAVFWIHSLLWMFRGFVENRQKHATELSGEGHHVPDAGKLYRRFKTRHIIMHILVIVSFLGLSLSGLPLKFADQQWAKVLMDIYGGTANAALIHRICAGITFIYFGAAIALSIHFLFIRKDEHLHWSPLMRLFGPDSLMPNLRDIQDVSNMMRWFLFLGPKPTFERWTYWEKFDFIAVFWGMFAIGGSGLMLWFPEIFGSFLPGWVFNVATIIHSDEALLATGFIFSVHFFNTHGRPEKFPMDFVIFNGLIEKEELVEERGDQMKRYEDAGILEEHEADKPTSALYDFLFKGFGFTAVFIGLSLLVLMIYAFTLGGHHF